MSGTGGGRRHGDGGGRPNGDGGGRSNGDGGGRSNGASGAVRSAGPTSASRSAYTFCLDADLVERARREVGERDVVRSIEAALAAALDYHSWLRDVRAGRRDVLA